MVLACNCGRSILRFFNRAIPFLCGLPLRPRLHHDLPGVTDMNAHLTLSGFGIAAGQGFDQAAVVVNQFVRAGSKLLDDVRRQKRRASTCRLIARAAALFWTM